MVETTNTALENYKHIDCLVKRAIGGDNKAVEELLYCYKNLLDSLSKRYYRACRCQFCEFLDDLKSKFYIFLLAYKFERNVFFSTYISCRLHWYAYNCLTEQKDYENNTKSLEVLSIKELSSLTEPNKADMFLVCNEVMDFVKHNFSASDYRLFYLYYYNGEVIQDLATKVKLSETNIQGRLNKMKLKVQEAFGE